MGWGGVGWVGGWVRSMRSAMPSGVAAGDRPTKADHRVDGMPDLTEPALGSDQTGARAHGSICRVVCFPPCCICNTILG